MEARNAIIDIVTYEQAAEYIQRLVHNGLNETFEHQIGGVLNGEKIKKWIYDDDFSGLMFWFGFKRGGGNKPELFVEKKRGDFIYNDINDIRILTPGGLFKFLLKAKDPIVKKFEKKSSKKEIESWIKSLKDTPQNGYGDVNALSARGRKDRFILHPKLENHIKVGFTFFALKEDNSSPKLLKQFFEQGEGVTHIRYFFGFDDSEKSGDHHIRLTLAPVKSDGTSFLKEDLKPEFKNLNGGEPLLLQTSWPPPPKQI